MPKPDIILIGRHAYSWQEICQLHRQQRLRALVAHFALFELKDDCRPEAERTEAGRYREPTFLGLMAGDADA